MMWRNAGRRPLTSWAKWRQHRVLVSASTDVFTNLAMEDWLYKHWGEEDNSRGPLLLLWRNDPCVVIGRHQNPWLECRLSSMLANGVALARRNSGGGTVFHDRGNLNCTFFSRRSSYDRRANLALVRAAINDRWPHLRLTMSPRDDILVDDVFKISGTAAKLGRESAYHHCTVLFDVNKRLLTSVLKRRDEMDGLESKATASVASPVKNLGDVDASVQFEALVETIGNGFRKQFGAEPLSSPIPVFRPNEEMLPGVSDIENQLRSWDWIFGKSPRFILSKRYFLPPQIRHRAGTNTVSFNLRIYQGIIEELSFAPSCWLSEPSTAALGNLVGKRFPIGQPLTIDRGYWNESDARQQEENLFIRETLINCTTALM